jgi:hypothetical protein
MIMVNYGKLSLVLLKILLLTHCALNEKLHRLFVKLLDRKNLWVLSHQHITTLSVIKQGSY